MNRNRRIKIVTSGVALTLIVWAVVSSEDRKLLLYNPTPSVPIGWYVYAGRLPMRGEVVAFALPDAAHAYAFARGEATDFRLLKPVLALCGDHVSTIDGELRVNGVSFGPIAVTDAAGRMLPHWHADRVLTADELLVGSAAGHSFDGRFFGPIHTAQVQGVYRRFTLASTCDAPAEANAESSATRIGAASTMPRQ